MINSLKKIFAQNFESFTFYYQNLRYRVFLTLILSIFVGVLDGFGLSMFMPLLQMVTGNGEATGEAMGNLNFIVEGLESLGISMNLINILGVMVVFFTFKGIASFINSSYRVIVRNMFIKKIRKQILSAFNRLKYKYFVLADVGRIQNTMSGEVERVSQSFNFYFRTAEQAIMVAVYMGFAFFVDARFALLVTIGGWLTNFLYKIIYKRTKSRSKTFTEDSHGYQGQIIQHVANFKYLKATNLLQDYGRHLRESIDNIEVSRKKIGILNAIVSAAREPLLILIVAVVIIIHSKLLNASLGPILISLLFFYRALTALINMQNSWNRFLALSGSLSNVISFQDELRNNKEKQGGRSIQRFTDSIKIEYGWFKYTNEWVLKNINLTLPKNQTIAFVGESGSGKTTLVNIIAGLMPLDEGTFKIDGIDSKELDTKTYQNRIGYITQEPVIFSDSIFNNVTFWDEKNKRNLERFRQALNKAAILDFVDGLTNQEKTELGSNGVNLSGGQRQRLSIARELYKEVDVLIMDEATSSLDSETEKMIQDSIDALKGEFTILIVAHRLSTIKNADKIVYMNEGEIDTIGTYTELIAQVDGFEKMVELQKL